MYEHRTCKILGPDGPIRYLCKCLLFVDSLTRRSSLTAKSVLNKARFGCEVEGWKDGREMPVSDVREREIDHLVALGQKKLSICLKVGPGKVA